MINSAATMGQKIVKRTTMVNKKVEDSFAHDAVAFFFANYLHIFFYSCRFVGLTF